MVMVRLRSPLAKVAKTSKSVRQSRPLYAATNKVRKETGKRSGLEVKVAAQFEEAGVSAIYEPRPPIPFHYPGRPRPAKYLPDFRLPNGIYIETKGWFKSEDRKKHLLIKFQQPHLDIRFVFSNPSPRSGRSPRQPTPSGARPLALSMPRASCQWSGSMNP